MTDTVIDTIVSVTVSAFYAFFAENRVFFRTLQRISLAYCYDVVVLLWNRKNQLFHCLGKFKLHQEFRANGLHAGFYQYLNVQGAAAESSLRRLLHFLIDTEDEKD